MAGIWIGGQDGTTLRCSLTENEGLEALPEVCRGADADDIVRFQRVRVLDALAISMWVAVTRPSGGAGYGNDPREARGQARGALPVVLPVLRHSIPSGVVVDLPSTSASRVQEIVCTASVPWECSWRFESLLVKLRTDLMRGRRNGTGGSNSGSTAGSKSSRFPPTQDY